MASFIDDKASVDPPKAPKKPKKKPKKPPKSAEIVEDSSEEDNPDLDKPTESDKEFIDDEHDTGLDKDGRDDLDASIRRLKKKGELSPRKKLLMEEVLAESDEEPRQPPKRRRKEKRMEESDADGGNDDYDDPNQNDYDSYDENEGGGHDDNDDGDPEEKMTPDQLIEAMKCPFCHGDLLIGKSADKQTGELKQYCLCATRTCTWCFLPEKHQEEFISKAHYSVQKKYVYPNPKPCCHHDLPMKAEWIFDISKYSKEDGENLRDCIFLVCEIGTKDKDGRVPCDKVILCNMKNAKRAQELEILYKKAVMQKKVETSKSRKRFRFTSRNTSKRIKNNPSFLKKFGSR